MNPLSLGIQFPITDPTWIFFLVLMIILFAPILLGRLRIPHIIGMILAGVAIGKYGFNILERDSSFELFGKVGIYYIMFLAGFILANGYNANMLAHCGFFSKWKLIQLCFGGEPAADGNIVLDMIIDVPLDFSDIFL